MCFSSDQIMTFVSLWQTYYVCVFYNRLDRNMCKSVVIILRSCFVTSDYIVTYASLNSTYDAAGWLDGRTASLPVDCKAAPPHCQTPVAWGTGWRNRRTPAHRAPSHRAPQHRAIRVGLDRGNRYDDFPAFRKYFWIRPQKLLRRFSGISEISTNSVGLDP